MKKNYSIWLWLLALCSIFASCKKDNADSKTPQDILPPATQTGANTFGCLVNGKVWIPKGYSGNGTPNPHLIYEIGLNGRPVLAINCTQFLPDNTQSYCNVAFKNLNHLGQYFYPNEFTPSVGWTKVLGNCYTQVFDSSLQIWGAGEITKLDITTHIISGTFNFKFKTLQCDTVFITDGRFDIKF